MGSEWLFAFCSCDSAEKREAFGSFRLKKLLAFSPAWCPKGVLNSMLGVRKAGCDQQCSQKRGESCPLTLNHLLTKRTSKMLILQKLRVSSAIPWNLFECPSDPKIQPQLSFSETSFRNAFVSEGDLSNGPISRSLPPKEPEEKCAESGLDQKGPGRQWPLGPWYHQTISATPPPPACSAAMRIWRSRHEAQGVTCPVRRSAINHQELLDYCGVQMALKWLHAFLLFGH